jgi:addiction module HigA family antidote
MELAGRAQGARKRRCGDIVDDEQRRDRPASPMRPKGSGGAWASASLVLLDNVPALPASHRLASAHAALGTRHILILGQAPRGLSLKGRMFVEIKKGLPPIHPGKLLCEEIMPAARLTQESLAGRLGVSRRKINEIINEKRSMSADKAIGWRGFLIRRLNFGSDCSKT